MAHPYLLTKFMFILSRIFFFLLIIDGTIENNIHSRIKRQDRRKSPRPGETPKQGDRLQVVDRLAQPTQNSDVIKRILSRNPNDYYGILGLDKRATWSDVHKAYSKLNLLVHPDKNKSPDATKATQMLNKARDELRKILLDQNGRPRTVKTEISVTVKMNYNRNQDVVPETEMTTTEPRATVKKKDTLSSSNLMYLVSGFAIFIVGIVFLAKHFKQSQQPMKIVTSEVIFIPERNSDASETNDDGDPTNNRNHDL
ncbi:unnamed protein product [Adineta ricciae]|uniref:J domain-containing protein n=1 Tax=Adineta ricciae TaxID=249248 RepID=A0A813WS02_ADIRI|nr:unnamed protein product [Adineta ricciae]CAF0865296.1 unnamed protein product [Adineta ricciae]